MDLIAKSKELRENPEYSGPIWDLERLETMFEMESEIAQLKAELELTRKVIEQATKGMAIEGDSIIFANVRASWMRVIVGNKDTKPELYAHLAGRGE